MGNTESAPFAMEERDAKYEQKPPVSSQLFEDHMGGRLGELPPDLLLQVPHSLVNKVSLHQSVDLSFNLITSIPVDLPLSLPHVVHLNLSHNKITSLPDSIFGFLHLEHLDLSYNKLDTLPPAICFLAKLRKLNLSSNQLTVLPPGLDQLTNLERLDMSNNLLDHLPLCLGSLPRLQVLLAGDNPLPHLGKEVTSTSDRLVTHLQSCYLRSVSPEGVRLQGSSQFIRVRGPVFDSRVLNSGSAQALFNQMQAQAVNTGNRILTPMIPPVGSTRLDAERLRDAVLGMFYGCLVGDSLGLLTDFMTRDQALFHYEGQDLGQEKMWVDRYRARYVQGEASPALHLVSTTLESVVRWAGVVDELDYSARLVDWLDTWVDKVESQVIHSVVGGPEFRNTPTSAAETHCQEKGDTLSEVVDDMCLPPAIGLVISQFHRSEEVRANAARICSSTHSHPVNIKCAVGLAGLLASLLQGETLDKALEPIRDLLGQSEEVEHIQHPATCLLKLVKAEKVFQTEGFKGALTEVVMQGGHSSVAGCVAGAVFGLVAGFSYLPPVWVGSVMLDIRQGLDKKLNNLFDMMGLP